jgi:protein involved in polysaccharide export with SLBB domain
LDPVRFPKVGKGSEPQYIDIKIEELLKGNEAANPRILSGDIIEVLAAYPIYVIGGVENPTRIFMRGEMTLTRAVSSAGGLSRDADPARVTIFRQGGEGPAVIDADLEKIDDKQTEDITLRAYDVIEVARKGREKRRKPIVSDLPESNKNRNSKLPLEIID